MGYCQRRTRLALWLVAAFCVASVSTSASNEPSPPVGPAAESSDDVLMNTRDSSFTAMCPNMLQYIFEDATPHNESSAGTYVEYSYMDPAGRGSAESDLSECVNACCAKERSNSCHVVLVYKQKCYHVRCVSNEACLPKQRPASNERLQMILVNPVRVTDDDRTSNWLDVLKATRTEDGQQHLLSDLNAAESVRDLNFWRQPHKFHMPSRSRESVSDYVEDSFPLAEKRVQQLLLSSSAANEAAGALTPDDLALYGAGLSNDASLLPAKYVMCRVDLSADSDDGRCPPKEECLPIRKAGGAGVCKCMHGYERNQMRECVPDLDYSLLEESGGGVTQANTAPGDGGSEQLAAVQNKAPSAQTEAKLTVSVVSKEVRLPEKEVTLAAFTVPDEESSASKYKYLWTLISQPKGPMNGTISDQSRSKVTLTNLSEGLYTFRVSVTGGNGTFGGEATANVTVLPEKRINRMPQAIITPAEQKIRQPTTNAILDGSTSTDDDKIISWHWEIISGPIGYQPQLPDVNTLQLSDLKSPGNYTFKLTVTDSDNETNSTTANICVLKETDYPPVANAGDAVILYLPNNNVTLNGTASTDDHEIVAWEWTKDASDESKAVDMQNTRTPYVQLSNLEEGIYTFELKVTDGIMQSSTAKVHVFVKPPTNSPPVANAGGNVTVNLPQNWAPLNGSQSADDIGIVQYHWRQTLGPNNAIIANTNASIANATLLTLGLYEFELSVSDANNNTATDKTWVQVVQERNAAPVANGGGDQSVTLPLAALYLNGSRSSDDLAVTKYVWTRDEASLAAGLIVGNTASEPVLILAGLVPGRYIFKLTVSDEQGLTSSDSVSVIVHPDTHLMHLVQLTLPMGISVLTQTELDTIVQKLSLLLGDMRIQVRGLQYDPRSEATILEFYAETKASGESAVDGFTIERMLKEKLHRDASILGTVFIDIRSTVCQNKCSGHGVCNAATRACICEAFWMPSVYYFWDLDEANCDWSILYVFVGIMLLFGLLSGICWALVCACSQSKKPRARPKVQKYSLIGAQDEEAPQMRRTNSLSDSETDSDVLFETRSKSANGIMRLNGATKAGSGSSRPGHGQAQAKYAITKLGRKIKT